MKIAILKEHLEIEKRVAATPETVKKFIALGSEVAVQQGAGEAAGFHDADYIAAGAEIFPNTISANVYLKVATPTAEDMDKISRSATLIALLDPFNNRESVAKFAAAGIDAFALELLPRISRAQSMDVLSSQSNLAGYRAVIEAANVSAKCLPMMMTAAGTISAARVFIIGVGVAGLQAIATAKRLGAIVSAYDVRSATKEQVQSLGATFVEVPSDESGDAAGGYAKEMSEAYKQREKEVLTAHLAKQDIVITTALIPGKPAPILISDEMLKTMKNGAVIADLAAAGGGNVSGCKRGDITTTTNGVKIMGYTNYPAHMPAEASQLYARNIFNFISAFFDKQEKQFKINMDDEIIKGSLLTHNGQIIHPAFKA